MVLHQPLRIIFKKVDMRDGQGSKGYQLSFGSHQMHLITKTPVSLGMQNWRLSEDTWRTQKNVDVANFCTTLILSWLPHYHRETLHSVVMSVPDLSPLLSKHLKLSINHRTQTIDLTL